ncbi:hypothetical protein [Parenemella sanctibonifatiensis]|uniref:Uncharacterized protein n=1 Tax=Parenemella sanctibonifatiensis TaxID=2016505 RepID=A0A255EHI8_9ACTN|nr:hypothetical protein [Parenemella sanctibonifatiensis]OYN90989.1 hypothetical protein CGZ91_05800 [Parenemella sanctibonifatiensis]
MRIVLNVMIGAVVALVHVLFGGLIAVQISATEGGAVVDLSNAVASVRDPGPAPLANVALVILGCVALGLIGALPGQRRDQRRTARPIAYVVISLALIVTALRVEVFPPEGFFLGPLGWLVEGGQDSSVQLSCALAAVVVVMSSIRGRVSADRDGSETVTDDH